MSDEYKVQISYKFGNNGAGMLNVRGATVEEVDGHLSDARAVLLPALAGFEEDAKAIGLVVTAFPQTQVVAQANGGSVGQRPAQPGNGGGGTTCIHGARVFKQGDGWQGWFCPADRNDPTKCKPQYQR